MHGEYRSVHLVGRTFGEVVPSVVVAEQVYTSNTSLIQGKYLHAGFLNFSTLAGELGKPASKLMPLRTNQGRIHRGLAWVLERPPFLRIQV